MFIEFSSVFFFPDFLRFSSFVFFVVVFLLLFNTYGPFGSKRKPLGDHSFITFWNFFGDFGDVFVSIV